MGKCQREIVGLDVGRWFSSRRAISIKRSYEGMLKDSNENRFIPDQSLQSDSQEFATMPAILGPPFLDPADDNRENQIYEQQSSNNLEQFHHALPGRSVTGKLAEDIGFPKSSRATLNVTSARPAWPRLGGRYSGSAFHFRNAVSSIFWLIPSLRTSIRR